MFPGMNGLDPSKMTPQVIAEMTEAMKMLSPDQMMKLQTLMHNQLAGFDTTKDMIELEKGFPPGFRERMAKVLYLANGVVLPENPNEARLVILRSVAQGLMTPEDAARVLFPDPSTSG